MVKAAKGNRMEDLNGVEAQALYVRIQRGTYAHGICAQSDSSTHPRSDDLLHCVRNRKVQRDGSQAEHVEG